MKIIILAIFAITCSCCTCYSQVAMNNVKPSIINGQALQGSTTKTTKIINQKPLNMFYMDITIGDMKVTGSFHSTNSKVTMNSNWCLNKNQVVQFGHDKAKQTVVLMPNVLYGSDVTCWVSGYLFHDIDNDDSYVTRQVKFNYVDPAQGDDVTEDMTGGIMQVGKNGNTISYDLSFSWRNANIDSFDSVFLGTLRGAVKRTIITDDESVNNGMILHRGDQIINYDLKADNMTNQQLNNFVNWWAHCVLPSF